MGCQPQRGSLAGDRGGTVLSPSSGLPGGPPGAYGFLLSPVSPGPLACLRLPVLSLTFYVPRGS